MQTTRTEVQGNADRCGAHAVQAELVRRGVLQAAINIQGLGNADPLVPTSAGVREPQNRRVEIILQ